MQITQNRPGLNVEKAVKPSLAGAKNAQTQKPLGLGAQADSIQLQRLSTTPLFTGAKPVAFSPSEGQTGPTLISEDLLRQLNKLQPGESLTHTFKPNPDRGVNESIEATYTGTKNAIEVHLKQRKGLQAARSFAAITIPRDSKIQLELSRTKGDRVLVLSQDGVKTKDQQPIGAILRNVAKPTEFRDPNTGKLSAVVHFIDPATDITLPTTNRVQPSLPQHQNVIKQMFIAAAGDGTRMHPYAQCKPLTELVGGMTMTQALVEQFLNKGVERIGISVRETMMPEFTKALKPFIDAGQVVLVPEKNAFGDASGAVKALHTTSFINPKQPLMIAFADAITEVNLKDIADKWQALGKKQGDMPFATLITRKFPIADTLNKYGYVPTETANGSDDGKILGFEEKPKSQEAVKAFFEKKLGKTAAKNVTDIAANTGMAILSPTYLEMLKAQWDRYPKNPDAGKNEVLKFCDLYMQAAEEKRSIYAINMGTQEPWIDGGNGSDLAKGRAAVLNGGVRITVPPSAVEENLAPQSHPGAFFNKGTKESALRWNPGIEGNVDFVVLPQNTKP